MRVAIAGAGNVGVSIARSLLAAGHKVLLIERQRAHYRPRRAPEADWMFADACEISTLQAAAIETADVVIAATGDDNVNLVFSMLCKNQFAVSRVVARVNKATNQWLFDRSWGVDVAVSTPGSLVAAVEEAMSTGEVIRLMTLQHGQGSIIELTLPGASHLVGTPAAELRLPQEATLLAISRGDTVLPPAPDLLLAAGDELVVLVAVDAEDDVRALLLRSV
jgi:trk system potassium uptake protein TrkA